MLTLIVWKTGDRFGFLLRSPDGDLLQDAYGYDSEEEAIAEAEATAIGDEEYRIVTYTNVGKMHYSDGRRVAHADDAIAMARAEGQDV